MKTFLKYLPGVIGAVTVAIFFQHQSAQGIILAVMFALLISLVVALSTEIVQGKERDDRLERKIEELTEDTSDHFGEMSVAVLHDMQVLADQVGTEIHELALMIADYKFGEEEGED